MFAAHGRAGMTMRNIADALDLSRDTLRRHICDIHHLPALVLAAHLATLTAVTERLDATQPNLIARRREVLRHIATDRYGYTAGLHVLLDRERSLLPDDDLGPIEAQFAELATLLGAIGPDAAQILFPAPEIAALAKSAAPARRIPSRAAEQTPPPAAQHSTSQPATTPKTRFFAPA